MASDQAQEGALPTTAQQNNEADSTPTTLINNGAASYISSPYASTKIMANIGSREPPPEEQSLDVLSSLPAEIMQLMYQAYFAVDGGYIYNFATGKLGLANVDPIDFSLMLTCQLVGREIAGDGPALMANSVTFKTACSTDHHNISSGHFHHFIE